MVDESQSGIVDKPASEETSGSPPRIRLLILSSDTFPPTRVDVLVLFGHELSGRGHKADLILQSEEPCSRSYETSWGGGKIWVGKTDLGGSLWRRVHKHVSGILHDLKVFALMRSDTYNVVEVKDKFISGIFAVLAARMFRKRFVYWLSYPFPEEYLLRARNGTARYPFLYVVRGHVFGFLLYKVLLPLADHVFVQSEQMRKDIAEQGLAIEKMTAVPMGIDGPRFANYEKNSSLPRVIAADEPSILYLGTLAKTRRLDFLLRVLALTSKAVPGVRLYLVGKGEDPSDEAFLVSEAERLGVSDSIRWIGQLPQIEALAYVRDARVCLSPFFPTPTLNSTSPTKLVEYMAMGKAVVANNHPEQRLILEESGGGYCVPYEEKPFADAIGKLLASPEMAARMGERGRKYALEHRSYEKIADLVEATFRILLRDGKR